MENTWFMKLFWKFFWLISSIHKLIFIIIMLISLKQNFALNRWRWQWWLWKANPWATWGSPLLPRKRFSAGSLSFQGHSGPGTVFHPEGHINFFQQYLLKLLWHATLYLGTTNTMFDQIQGSINCKLLWY